MQQGTFNMPKRFAAWGWITISLLVGCAAQSAGAQQRGEMPLQGADVFVDQPDNLSTRVKVQADKKGVFKVSGLKPGMWRVVVQTTDLAPGEKKEENPTNVGAGGLRNAARWGEARRNYGRMKYATVYIDSTSASGPSSMNQKLVNGRTAGVFVNITQPGEVLSGKAMGTP